MSILTFPTFVIALFLSFAPTSRAEDFTCPVTKASPITFEPVGVWAHDRAYLLGTEKLFTVLPNWQLGVQWTERGYHFPKIVWGTTVVDLHEEVRSTLTITGRRLNVTTDPESSPLVFGRANTAWIDQANRTGWVAKPTPVTEVDKGDFFITSDFYVPTRGCWEVTGHFHGEDLKVVIEVR
jgi:hypothetical protein